MSEVNKEMETKNYIVYGYNVETRATESNARFEKWVAYSPTIGEHFCFGEDETEEKSRVCFCKEA